MVQNRIIFFATSVQPNPEEIDYWVDLSDNPYGGSIKYFNGTEWVRLAASGGTPDLNNYYTKTQVNKLLNDKANVSDVDSKVDDEEVKDVIKDIQFNTSNPNNITMVMFKYDGSNKTVSIPVATSGDYNDLINKLKPGKDVSISEDNVISIAIDSDSLEQSLATLQSNIDKEAATARAAETKLGNDIATEKNRAESAEQTISTNLQNEINRSTQVDTQHTNAINKEVQDRKEAIATEVSDRNAAILVETNRAKAKEEELDNKITDHTAATNAALALKADKSDTYTLPTASSSVLGGVKTGSNITNTDGTISLTKANVTSALGVDPTTTYVKKAGDTMTGALTNSSTISGSKLISTVSTGTAPIQVSSTTLCTNLNADMIDGYDVAEGDKTGIYYTKFYGVSDNNTDWLRLATLPLVSQNTTSAKYVIFEIVGGGNYGSNQYNYSTLVASTRDKESVKLVKQQSNTQLSGDAVIAGYVVTSTNVEIWLGFTGTYRSSISITCKNKQLANDVLTSSFVTTKPDNFVLGEIVTLDAPDWYGVSWSETSSNPDCTRIGNMDMHRTLPIQSMMKGYIYFKDGNPLYRMLKLNDSWTKCENYSAGGWRDVDTLLEDNNVNVMIKIPEFWWIDDYTESTETHNLKICPHAKPGWHHHKEAYVSAYEGYIDGDCYRSSKNNIPSVNFTRSAVRPKARANGLGNSWNIYTYNEHRAICHLFLVEYATRNSQKAVNTALTVEGFRQGGLGSGCTAGTVTINGATTYSFIPTGSSDSLGSGSGEVTVTIQQTDSSGANTTTTTRKCNRYRGIENPFGHVWKHTDDVISVYVSGYGARFWYKCDSPDHFGDSILNANPYYKNIAASAVVTGYKTRIVTTSTCDFFALSCNNGSETTYWCDYNWDNTDASEHCLLIGSYSGNGGWAGLFALHSSNGVGYSSADVGSRLTYLPWAE